jgi:hypothetical protein
LIAYHGTNILVATRLASNPSAVDITRGGGELGRGFYLGESVALAAAWAQGRFSDPAVLQVGLSDTEYVRLSILTLKQNEVLIKWQELKKTGRTRLFVFGFDVIYAPFATYPAWQHKFETTKSYQALKRGRWSVL